jgi:hypothetical protein
MGRASAIVALTWQDLFEADYSLGGAGAPMRQRKETPA